MGNLKYDFSYLYCFTVNCSFTAKASLLLYNFFLVLTLTYFNLNCESLINFDILEISFSLSFINLINILRGKLYWYGILRVRCSFEINKNVFSKCIYNSIGSAAPKVL